MSHTPKYFALTGRTMRGFTLFELIIVILLIAVLAVTAMLQWPGQVLNLDAQAHQLAGDIRYVQSLSMTRGQRFRINIGTTSYTILDQTGATYPHPIAGAAAVPLDQGITLAPASLLVFDGKGVPYTTAPLPGVPLAGVMTLTLNAADGDSRQIQISGETGRVVVQ